MQTQSNEINFNGQHIYVGIDVHLKSWKVSIMTERLPYKTFSQNPDPDQLHKYLIRNFPNGIYHSAYEAGFCGYWIHNKFMALGIDSIVVNPADIPTTDKEKVQKADKRDSQKIAKSLRNGDLKGIHVLSGKTLEDRCLIRTRATIVQDLTRNKNRIKSFLNFHGIEMPDKFKLMQHNWSNRFVEWLKSIELSEQSAKKSLNLYIEAAENLRLMILDATREIRHLSLEEPYAKQVLLLRGIPGIGLLTAMIILTELETINRFNNFDKLCSFIGLIPSTHSSGEKENIGEITHRGNSLLRAALVESSWIAARVDLALNKSYHDYCKRMEPNKAIIRIARKLLNRIRFVLKNNQPYKCAIVK
jgi:transposase